MSSKKDNAQFLKGLRTYRVASEAEASAIQLYLEALDCPRSLAVWMLFKYQEHPQLAEIEFDPSSYANAYAARDAYSATLFLSKFKGLTLGYDLDERALEKFEKFEQLCRQTNTRFRNLSVDPQFNGSAVQLHSAVVRKIERLLGDFDPREFYWRADWGPGASTLIKRQDASIPRKFRLETGVTRDLYDLLPLSSMKAFSPSWGGSLEGSEYPNFQVGNKVITVAKDAKANRVIAIEPGLNLFFQKSLGNMIGSRLLRVGVDLRDQGGNQRLAKRASIDASLATVDLSSASDSIALELVRELLPPRWFSVLDSCRSHYGLMKDQVRRWEKFSSMGNGFTFQLESLIFYALAKSCAEYVDADLPVSVYGDDIVLPVSCFHLFSKMMSFYGFRLNESKSFHNSPFRESCGAHYFLGLDLKPIFLKERLTNIGSIYRLANAIRRQAHTRNTYGCDVRFRKAFDFLVASVPRPLRLRIPESLGDGGFIANFDEAVPARARHGVEGYQVRNLVQLPLRQVDESIGYYLAELWRLSSQDRPDYLSVLNSDSSRLKATDDWPSERLTGEGRNSVPLRKFRWTLVRSLVRRWTDLGPWW